MYEAPIETDHLLFVSAHSTINSHGCDQAITSKELITAVRRVIDGDKVTVQVRPFLEGATIPTKGTPDAAGYDLSAWCLGQAPDSLRTEDGMEDGTEDGTDHWNGDTLVRVDRAIPPRSRAIIRTGLNVLIPHGYEIQVRPRSGLAAKHGITVTNSPGTVDSDYRGVGEKTELKVLLTNHGDQPFTVEHGMRIAQMVIARVHPAELVQVDEFDEAALADTVRDGGFGSTGTR